MATKTQNRNKIIWATVAVAGVYLLSQGTGKWKIYPHSPSGNVTMVQHGDSIAGFAKYPSEFEMTQHLMENEGFDIFPQSSGVNNEIYLIFPTGKAKGIAFNAREGLKVDSASR